MTDIREKVARALRSTNEPAFAVVEWDKLADWARDPWLEMSDAALAASGHAELVTALDKLVRYASVTSSVDGVIYAGGTHREVITESYRALAKARGEP